MSTKPFPIELNSVESPLHGFFIARQDTVPPAVSVDTLETAHDGIDPLFLMSERKAQEVEAYKTEIAQKQVRAVKRPAPVPVDTTCHICPQGERVSFQSLVSIKNQEPNFFGLDYLYDKSHYKEFIGPSGPVFIETQPQPTIQVSQIQPQPIQQSESGVDWIFFPLLALILLVGFIKVFYYQHISSLFRSAVYYFLANKMTRDNSVLWNRIFFMLDVVFFVSLPLVAAISINQIELTPNFEVSPFLVAVYVFIGLVAFRVFKYFSIKIIGLASNQQKEFNTLYYNQLLYPRALGLIIVPLIIFIVYTNSPIKEILFYLLIGFISLVIIIRALRIFQVFISKGFSVFYLFLYLCALEIIPILVVIKEIFWE